MDAVFERIVHEAETIDILVNSVCGGYERMIDNGAFTAHFIGRAVAALAADPDVLRHSGKVVVAAALATDNGFTDLDGKTPRPLTLADV